MPDSNIIQIDQNLFETKLDRLVTEKMTQILNAMLDAEADEMVVPEKLRTLDHGRPWSDDQFASTRLSSNRDMSR